MIKTNLKKGLLVFAIFLTTTSFGQEIDSLNRLLSATHNVERKIEIYTILGKHLQMADLKESRITANKALALSKSTNTTTYLGEIYGLFGDIAVMQDSLLRAKVYYEIALDHFKKSNDLKGVTGVTFVLGNIALTHEDLSTAMQYYLKTVENAKLSGLEDWLPSIYMNIGIIYQKSGEIKEAQEYFSRSLEQIAELGYTVLAIEANNNLGITYLDLGELGAAKDYFNNALTISEELGTFIRAAQVKQNLGRVYSEEGNYFKAIQAYLEAKDFLEKGNPNYTGPKQTFWAKNHVGLGKNYLLLNKTTEAHDHLMQGFKISLNTGHLKTSIKATKYLSAYWEQMENTDSALFYYKQFKNYTDRLNNDDNIRKLEFQKARFKYEQDMLVERQERDKQTARHRRNIITLVLAIVGLIMVMALLVLLLKLSRNKATQAGLEHENLKKELELRNKELTTHLMYQVKNNEFILNISKKLKELLTKATPENSGPVNELIREIELDSSTDQWEQFEIRFQQVHTDFYKNIGKNYPDLSSNELRLCAFLRLNMNTKDIAAITYQSINSITVARWRMRQKFGLIKEESLAAFLTQF